MPPTTTLPRNPAVLRVLQRVAALSSHGATRPRRDAAFTTRSAPRPVDTDGSAVWRAAGGIALRRSGAAFRAAAGDGRRGMAGEGGILQARQDEKDGKGWKGDYEAMLVQKQEEKILKEFDYVKQVSRCLTDHTHTHTRPPGVSATHLFPELSGSPKASVALLKPNGQYFMEPLQTAPSPSSSCPPPLRTVSSDRS